ncbi:MAG: 4-hydroxy-tetrahydrodipicolinate synthase [Nannocystaceae bacterium]|nr:4-hydroxy-tetrahydrodipicolinate synthase [bacterium]
MFSGAFTALATPFRNGALDKEALKKLVEAQIKGGIDGLVPCGTTGESPTLSHAEQIEVITVVAEAASGRVPLIAGAGSNSTAEAIEMASACKDLGVAATLQVMPYYNKPSQQGMRDHILRVVEASGVPAVLYNVPSRTVVDLQPATVAELAKHELVVAIKEATGDMNRAIEIREQVGHDFALLSGDDFTLLPFLSVGGNGVISVGSNIVPGLFARLCEAAANGRYDEARDLQFKLQPLNRAMFCASNPGPLKAGLAKLGIMTDEVRSPLQAVTEGTAAHTQVMDALRALELV